MTAKPHMNTSLCRSCGARIVWAKTPTGLSTPVDAEPSVDGNLVLVSGPQGWLACPVRADTDVAGRHKSHFATCPNADQHRKPRLTAKLGDVIGKGRTP